MTHTIQAITLFGMLFFSNSASAANYEAYAFCNNPSGAAPVRIINSISINNIGYAMNDQYGFATIYWNPAVAQRMGNLLATFFAFHECSHIQLHHSLRPNNYHWPQAKEQEADCYAIRMMNQHRMLDHHTYRRLKQELSTLQPFDTPTHYAGWRRANNLDLCFQ